MSSGSDRCLGWTFAIFFPRVYLFSALAPTVQFSQVANLWPSPHISFATTMSLVNFAAAAAS